MEANVVSSLQLQTLEDLKTNKPNKKHKVCAVLFLLILLIFLYALWIMELENCSSLSMATFPGTLGEKAAVLLLNSELRGCEDQSRSRRRPGNEAGACGGPGGAGSRRVIPDVLEPSRTHSQNDPERYVRRQPLFCRSRFVLRHLHTRAS